MISPSGTSEANGASCRELSQGFVFREKLSIFGDSSLRRVPSPCRELPRPPAVVWDNRKNDSIDRNHWAQFKRRRWYRNSSVWLPIEKSQSRTNFENRNVLISRAARGAPARFSERFVCEKERHHFPRSMPGIGRLPDFIIMRSSGFTASGYFLKSCRKSA